MPNLDEAINDIHQDEHIITLNHIALVTASIITIALIAIIGCLIYKLFDNANILQHSNQSKAKKLRTCGRLLSLFAIIFVVIAVGCNKSRKIDLSNAYNAHITNNNLTIRIHQKRFQKDKTLMDSYYTVSYEIKHHKISTGTLSPAAKRITGKNSPRAQLNRYTHHLTNKYNKKTNHEYEKELTESNYLTKYMSLAKPHKPHWYNYLLL